MLESVIFTANSANLVDAVPTPDINPAALMVRPGASCSPGAATSVYGAVPPKGWSVIELVRPTNATPVNPTSVTGSGSMRMFTLRTEVTTPLVAETRTLYWFGATVESGVPVTTPVAALRDRPSDAKVVGEPTSDQVNGPVPNAASVPL